MSLVTTNIAAGGTAKVVGIIIACCVVLVGTVWVCVCLYEMQPIDGRPLPLPPGRRMLVRMPSTNHIHWSSSLSGEWRDVTNDMVIDFTNIFFKP